MPETPRPRPLAWRVGTPVVAVLCGTLFVVSSINSDGTDLRAGRYSDLESLVQAETDEATALTRRVAELNDEVDTLSAGLGDRTVSRFQDDIETMEAPAGLTEVEGEAVRVTLTDASADTIAAVMAKDAKADPNDYIVHQQDIQAVANAMWSAGAEAVTIQGQRIVSTTGIKCEGNSVTLHGVPYSPPYEIVAVGDQADLMRAVEDDLRLQIYRAYAAAPGGGVGWEVDEIEDHTAPGFTGVLDLDWAQPMTNA